VREFIEQARAVVSPDEKAWLISTVLSDDVDAAFAWNQWELDSVEAADDDAELLDEIRQFWDNHFPVVMSVKSGYAYFAIQNPGHTIVRGEELEYEEATDVTDSFTSLLKMISSGDPKLGRWI
jgi:hypothetical protein